MRLAFSPSPQHTDSHIPCGYHKTPTIPQAFHSALSGYTWASLLLRADLFLPRPLPSSPFLQSIIASLGLGDLVDIISPSASAVVYPTDDAILQALQASGHFNGRGHISGSKALTYGLHKSRSNHLSHDECTYHIFYQLVARLRGFVYARSFV